MFTFCDICYAQFQLEAGIRYFDLRVAYMKESFYIVHGLQCMEIIELFRDVSKFLELHSKEVVLLDINHFYEFYKVDGLHEKLLKMIDTTFGDKLIERPENTKAALSYTLNKLWTGQGRVIVFYQYHQKNGCIRTEEGCNCIELPKYVWDSRFIKSPWPKTDNAQKMISDITSFLNERVVENGFQAQLLRSSTNNLK
ncbi:hypothetical protein AB6A40_008580 [Gnathostoma spinigerum]|uniref:Phosphatidylinositol-specific phospholipase C X domain-containing protein n=1 Tax=Gnathostoma spinigerum TaxID=75299 RepID=A0ABD6ERD1_9BILA